MRRDSAARGVGGTRRAMALRDMKIDGGNWRAAFDEHAALFERAIEVFGEATATYRKASAGRRRVELAPNDPVEIRTEPARVQHADVDTSPPAAVELTRRQTEVAILIARGLTNAQIAEELVVTRGTVANHVAQILDRLALRGRTQVAVWAIEHGLLRPGAG